MMNRPSFKYIPKAHTHMNRQQCMHKHIATNIVKTENGFEIQLALPGIDKSNVEIFIQEGILNIKSRESESKNEDRNYKLKQFDYSKFEKSFEISDDIDVDNINATYNEGILTLTLVNKEINESELVKKIEIN